MLILWQVVLDNGALSRIVADRLHMRPDSFDDKMNFDQTNQLVSSIITYDIFRLVEI